MKDEKGENERQGYRIPHSAFRIPQFNPNSPYSCLSASIGFMRAAMMAG